MESVVELRSIRETVEVTIGFIMESVVELGSIRETVEEIDGVVATGSLTVDTLMAPLVKDVVDVAVELSSCPRTEGIKEKFMRQMIPGKTILFFTHAICCKS